MAEDGSTNSDSDNSDAGIDLFAPVKRRKIDTKVKESKKINSHQHKPSFSSSSYAETFAELDLLPEIVNNLKNIGIFKPTNVQKSCIPRILSGNDVLACAETGSGKTAAFVLPICQLLCQEKYGIYALVISPTRELALQINEQVKLLGLPIHIRSELAIGGESMVQQAIQLNKRPHFVIGTPGRVLAHLRSPNPPFIKRLRFLVLDEADKLVSNDFRGRLTHILTKIDSLQEKWKNERQILMFSATVLSKLHQLNKFLIRFKSNEIFEFGIKEEEKAPVSLDERYVLCPKQVKICYFIYLIKLLSPLELIESSLLKDSKLLKKRKRPKDLILVETEEEDNIKIAEIRSAQLQRSNQMIVFVSTIEMCELLTEMLHQLKFSHDDLVALHSNLDQPRRNASLGKFRAGLAKILISTDVAARGLDIPKVDIVLNFDFPRNPEVYLHRGGRTARAGRVGRVITIVTERDIKQNKVKKLEVHCGTKLKALENISEEEALLLLTRSSNACIKAKSEIKLRKLK